ncbi:MAG: glycosyltransferase, partial [Chitinophagaceae bacterium]|nr:glycosyltransferase [Chitinophagaceae bacterium]
MHAPIAIFTYNRPDHFMETVAHLQKNKGVEETELFVFSDGAKTDRDKEIVSGIREFAGSIQGFKNVTLISSDLNMGLKASVRKGISHVLSMHQQIIVVEDDICSNVNFLDYH